MKFLMIFLFLLKIVLFNILEGEVKWLALLLASVVIVIVALWINYTRVNDMYQQYNSSNAEQWLLQALQELIALVVCFSIFITLCVNFEWVPVVFVIEKAVLILALLSIYYWGIKTGFSNALKRMEAINTFNNRAI